jgi:hypothetical protein
MKRFGSIVIAAAFTAALSAMWSCENPTSPSASCFSGPYTFDSNPSVNRCRAANGQFAPSACCGR